MANYFFRYDTSRKVWEVSTDGGGSFSDADQNFPNKVELGNYLEIAGISAPSVSPSGKCRLYFDSGANKLKISEDGGAYVDVI